jgi:hypothetical protein
VNKFLTLLTFLCCLVEAQADEEFERRYQTSHPAPSGAVVLEVARGTIEVSNGPAGSEVVVDVTQSLQCPDAAAGGVLRRLGAGFVMPSDFSPERVFARVAPRYREGAKEVRVKVADTRSVVFDWDASLQMMIHVRVVVPRGVNLRVRSVASGVTLADDYEGDVEVVNEQGSFFARRVLGDLKVRTDTGSVTVVEVTGRSDLRSESGLVFAGRLMGPADLRTSTGSVEVQQAVDTLKIRGDHATVFVGLSEPAPTSMDLRVSMGEIVLQMDRDLGLRLDADTGLLGRVRMRGLEPEIYCGAVDASSLRAVFNGGGPEARLRTKGGSIALVGREPIGG